MKKNNELQWNQLKTSYQSADFNFETTDELVMDHGMLSEIDAVEMLEFALRLKSKGYNLYISGEDEHSLYEYVIKKIETLAKQEKTPDDLCYIYNFKDPSVPEYLFMKPGEGMKFQNDMHEFRHFLIEELGERLRSYEVERKRDKLLKQLEEKRNILLEALDQGALEIGFTVEVTKEGIGFIPVDESGEAMEASYYEALDKEEKAVIQQGVEMLYDALGDSIERIKALEKEYVGHMADLDEEVIIEQIGYYTGYLRKEYGGYPEIVKYVDAILADVLENIELFENVVSEEADGLSQMLPWISPTTIKDVVNRYNVNVLVDRGGLQGAPVVTAPTLSYGDVLGKIKVDTEIGGVHTDFMNIYTGLLHQANGGYLVVCMRDILEAPGVWEAIKKSLKTETIVMESLAGPSITTTIGMTPEPCPLKVKLVVIGDYEVYDLLEKHDQIFMDLFKMHVNFGEVVDKTTDSIALFARLIKTFCDKEELPPVTKQGVQYLLEYNHRYAESSSKLSANMQPVYDLIREGGMFAETIISDEHLKRAKKMKEVFKSRVEKSLEEKYAKDMLLVDTKGKKVGQINGLAVYEVEKSHFGRPLRITATTYRGQAGVVDIENTVGLSGKIHAKGVQIITGFLGNYFAQDYPLSLSCRVCFEQSYGGIDGDSASSAELYAILSSIGDIPIKQGIAVTGSVNQYGEIQPIGGVNDKIEGFYRVCKKKGLTGKQGVIIPDQNKEELMLDDEVIEAVRKGRFHIYAIKSYQEGMQLLSGMHYDEIEDKVKAKLKRYSGQKSQLRKLFK